MENDLRPDSPASLKHLIELCDNIDFIKSYAQTLMERYDTTYTEYEDVPDDEMYILGDNIDAENVRTITRNMSVIQDILSVLEDAVDDDANKTRKITWDGEKFIDLSKVILEK